FTERSSGAVPGERAAGADLLVFPPRLEKFQSPEGACTSAISGWSMVRYVTISLRDIRNGQISAPTLNEFAWMNAGLPNAWSSDTERSSADTSPASRESFRLPSFTSRFSAVESSDSNMGLNWLTLIRNGRLTTATTKTATRMPTHFKIRRIQIPPLIECTLVWDASR